MHSVMPCVLTGQRFLAPYSWRTTWHQQPTAQYGARASRTLEDQRVALLQNGLPFTVYSMFSFSFTSGHGLYIHKHTCQHCCMRHVSTFFLNFNYKEIDVTALLCAWFPWHPWRIWWNFLTVWDWTCHSSCSAVQVVLRCFNHCGTDSWNIWCAVRVNDEPWPFRNFGMFQRCRQQHAWYRSYDENNVNP